MFVYRGTTDEVQTTLNPKKSLLITAFGPE
jgi:hypothetical protein